MDHRQKALDEMRLEAAAGHLTIPEMEKKATERLTEERDALDRLAAIPVGDLTEFELGFAATMADRTPGRPLSTRQRIVLADILARNNILRR